jgi:hypothetical protein
VLAPRTGPTGRYGFGERVEFMVGVRNRTDQAVEVSETNITASGNDAPAPVLRAVDVEDSVLASAEWGHVMNAIAGTLNSAAAMGAGRTSYSASGVVGGQHVLVSGQSYDHGAALRAQRDAAAETAANASAIEDRKAAGLAKVAALFQRNTIRPGSTYIGVAIIEPPRKTACGVQLTAYQYDLTSGPCKLRISVNVDGEIHTFDLNERRA